MAVTDERMGAAGASASTWARRRPRRALWHDGGEATTRRQRASEQRARECEKLKIYTTLTSLP
jgi:hypothetical protein